MYEKMTLQEYIESRNYKRRLSTKSKSRKKLEQRLLSPNLNRQGSPSVRQSSVSQSKDEQKIDCQPQLKDLVSEIKKIDQEVESFSLIHKKVEQVKQFARQYIFDDKVFVTLCRRLEELQNIYRLQLIEAYRFQLFKYKFDDETKLDEKRRKMVQHLSDLYLNSKFEYKKFIIKQRNELTKTQKLVIQHLIQEKAKIDVVKKNIAQSQNNVSELVATQTSLKQLKVQKHPTSFLQSLVMMGSNQAISQTQRKESNLFNEKIANNNIQNVLTEEQSQKDQIQIKINNRNVTRSTSGKKVLLEPTDFIKQCPNGYQNPNFVIKKQSLKNHFDHLINEIDQSDVIVSQSGQPSPSGSEIEANVLAFLGKKSSNQQKISKLQILSARYQQPEPIRKVQTTRYDKQRRKSAKKIIEQWERRKGVQSKDCPRVKRA